MNKKGQAKEEEKRKEQSPQQTLKKDENIKNIEESKGKHEKNKNSKIPEETNKKSNLDKKSNQDNNLETRKKNKEKVDDFQKYLSESGLPQAFELIFAELISKGIKQDNFYSYTAMRLRQIGKEIEELKSNESNTNKN
jgi:hypothetical protein